MNYFVGARNLVDFSVVFFELYFTFKHIGIISIITLFIAMFYRLGLRYVLCYKFLCSSITLSDFMVYLFIIHKDSCFRIVSCYIYISNWFCGTYSLEIFFKITSFFHKFGALVDD